MIYESEENDFGLQREHNLEPFFEVSTLLGSFKTGLFAECHDRICFISNNYFQLFVVIDGMGGVENPLKAPLLILEGLRKLEPKNKNNLLADCLEMIEAIHAQLVHLPQESGATLSMALVYDGSCRFINIGDSEGLLMGREGEIRYQTISQSIVGYAVEANLMTEKQGMRHEKSNILTQAFGMEPLTYQVSLPIKMNEGDYIILHTDGIAGNMTTEEMREIVQSSRKSSTSTQKVLKLLNEKHEKGLYNIDDFSFICAQSIH